MTIETGIVYSPRSNDELSLLTRRLRSELNEHFSFAPKSQPKLEEVVLGTLGFPNGRQQWQEQKATGSSSDFSLSLYVNMMENAEVDTDNEYPYLEIRLNDAVIARLQRLQQLTKEESFVAKFSDIKACGIPDESWPEAVVTHEGYFSISFQVMVKKMWPMEVVQGTNLTVDQIVAAYYQAKNSKAKVEIMAFAPRFENTIFLMKKGWLGDDLEESVQEQIGNSDEEEAREYFEAMSYGHVNEKAEVSLKGESTEIGLDGPSADVFDIVLIYEDWLEKQDFFADESESHQEAIRFSLLNLKHAIATEYPHNMDDALKDHLSVVRFGQEWGKKPEILEAIIDKIDDLKWFV